jgi:enamine deaminase RidA (YjgF/YER057c/UK114 family)
MSNLISKFLSQPMTILRWSSGGKGRSSCVASDTMVWAVANAIDLTANFESQVEQSFAMLDLQLTDAGSARTHLLSVQVILSHIRDRDVFDLLWQDWIGPDPAHWPQRSCFESALAPGLLIELVVTAAPKTATLMHAQ